MNGNDLDGSAIVKFNLPSSEFLATICTMLLPVDTRPTFVVEKNDISCVATSKDRIVLMDMYLPGFVQNLRGSDRVVISFDIKKLLKFVKGLRDYETYVACGGNRVAFVFSGRKEDIKVSVDLPLFDSSSQIQEINFTPVTEMRAKVKHIYDAIFDLFAFADDDKFILDLQPKTGVMFLKTTNYERIVSVPAEVVRGIDIVGVYRLRTVLNLLKRRFSDKLLVGMDNRGWLSMKYDVGWARVVYYVAPVGEI